MCIRDRVYSDGSHYIAIPHTPRKKRLKKGVKIKRQVPVMEELEEESTPFDGGVQMNMFDAENKVQTVEDVYKRQDGRWIEGEFIFFR